MTESVTVVIVSWNGLQHLKTCLAAMASQTVTGTRITLVDNASTDGTAEWVRGAYPRVQVIANARNVGFAQANNQALAATRSEYVALLNNDATPDPRWLEGLLVVAESDRSVGMVASQITLAHDPGTLDSAGIEVDALGMAWNRDLGVPAVSEGGDVTEVFGPSGAAALLRRSMLAEIGAFDARYFAYYEDVDLAWRAQRSGWRCLYAPAARVSHVHSATADQISGFKAYHIGRNKWRTLYKHYPFRRLASWVPLMVLVDTLAWLTRLARGDTSAFRGRWQAWGERKVYWAERQAYGDVGRVAASLSRPRLDRLLRPRPNVSR
ncbi:MAG: glycosyltransferase family 2 protein [Anaerolineae bacterium]|jgi:GT2 family glycosyltransferase|nr:glycosyltransferase family 2 protein [Anaerolineae bacterium]